MATGIEYFHDGAWLFATISMLVGLLVVYARWNYRTLEATGIPVVRPWFLFGSDPLFYRKSIQKQDEKWATEFGGIFGAYEGRSPTVYVTDPDLIYQIFVKDSALYFDERKRRPCSGNLIVDEFPDFLPRDKWKIGRSAIKPLFAPDRVHEMANDLARFMQSYLEQELGQKDEVVLELKEFIGPLLARLISKSFFDLTDQEHKEWRILELLQANTFEQPKCQGFGSTLLLTFPLLCKYFAGRFKAVDRFDKVLTAILASGRERSTKLVDTLRQLVAQLESLEFRRLGVTRATIHSIGFGMFVAGFDTTIHTVALCAFHLATHPEAQERCLQEIDVAANGNELELPFLAACIKETLRLYPPFPRSEIVCTKDWACPGSTIRIRRGTNVKILCWAANRSAKAYEWPDQFQPERFLYRSKPSCNPYTFTSFGFGPRSCAGHRLGLALPKAILSSILKEYRFGVETREVVLGQGCSQFLRFEPVSVRLIKRF